MWSIGCIAGELFKGKPIFPGKDTLNQIEEIFQYVKAPTQSDIETLKSDYGMNILKDAAKKMSSGKLVRKNFEDMFARGFKAGNNGKFVQAVDFVKRVLVFNVKTRASIDQLLEHPYVAEWRGLDLKQQKEGKVMPDDIGRDVTLREF